jgi:hypothetical protein
MGLRRQELRLSSVVGRMTMCPPPLATQHVQTFTSDTTVSTASSAAGFPVTVEAIGDGEAADGTTGGGGGGYAQGVVQKSSISGDITVRVHAHSGGPYFNGAYFNASGGVVNVVATAGGSYAGHGTGGLGSRYVVCWSFHEAARLQRPPGNRGLFPSRPSSGQHRADPSPAY